MRSPDFQPTVALDERRLLRLFREKVEEQTIVKLQNISYEE